MRWTGVVGAVALGACGSTADTTRAVPEPGDVSAAGGGVSGGRVVIPPSVNAEIEAWLAKEATLLADVVEIDATRTPFAAKIATATTRDVDASGRPLVEREETVDLASKVSTLTLTNRSGTTTLDTMPRVRLGDGRQFVATQRLVLRYVPIPGPERPIALVARGTGRARLLETTPERVVAGSSITLRADVVEAPGGFAFRPAEETRP